ncbi:serine hydrolase domain-containing protein [Streptomyces exfoliatus]|uniref:serine hydrolase domain-containing protein n=1 Tax=Streptomyces exfoliatus TaxID=1905 RepID=UPI0037932F56
MAISLLTRKVGAALAVAVALTVTAAGSVHGAPTETADSVMQDGLDAAVAAGYPGATALLRKDGASRYLAAGVDDRATRTPMDPKAQVRIGSNTKPFIGAFTMMLADQGSLSLDDTVDRWLPGVVTGNGNDGKKIKIRQLLNHTSGVPECLDRVTVDAYNNPTKLGDGQRAGCRGADPPHRPAGPHRHELPHVGSEAVRQPRPGIRRSPLLLGRAPTSTSPP